MSSANRVRPLIDVREEGRVLGPPKTGRLNGRWKANDWGLSAAPLTVQHRCKLRRIDGTFARHIALESYRFSSLQVYQKLFPSKTQKNLWLNNNIRRKKKYKIFFEWHFVLLTSQDNPLLRCEHSPFGLHVPSSLSSFFVTLMFI
jgi:hypothetical protein